MRTILSKFLDVYNVRSFLFSSNLKSAIAIRTALNRAGYTIIEPSVSTSSVLSSSLLSITPNEYCRVITPPEEDFNETHHHPTIILSSSKSSMDSPSNPRRLHLSSHLDEFIDLLCYDGALRDAADSTTYNAVFGPHLITQDQIFYSTDLSLGLVNIRPVLPGHVLVIPRRRVPRFTNLSNEEVSDLWATAKKVGKALESYFRSSSLTFTIQDGPEAGQSVPHVHIHILPRNKDDVFQSNNNDEIYRALEQEQQQSVSKSLDPHKVNPYRRSIEEMAAEASIFRKLCSETK